MIVADTNLIAYLFIPGEFTDLAEKELLRDPDWNAPWLWKSEMRNILSTYVRAKRLGSHQALAIMSQAEELMMGKEYFLPSMSVLNIAFESGLSACDCEFLALADELNCLLVTCDRKVVNAMPKLARGVG